MLTAALLLGAVVLLTAVIAPSRRGGGDDLVGTQMKKAGPPAPRRSGNAPSVVLDADVRRQVEELALLGRRVRAIELVRTATSPTPKPPSAASEPRRWFRSGTQMGPHRCPAPSAALRSSRGPPSPSG